MSALFPAAYECRRFEDDLTYMLSAARTRVNQGRVAPNFDRALFAKELAGFDFEAPVELDRVLDWAIAQMETGLVHVAHPRYFGLFNPTPTFPAQCADRIAAVFNPQLATATTSPTAVAIEAHVIRLLAQRFGLPPDSAGHFTTGGAEANCTALLLALTQACPSYASEGAGALNPRPTFYISRESHLAWLKIAHQTGIGRSAVRLIATDGSGRMAVDHLAATITVDKARECQPVMVVATAGTTNAGMIDPLDACADVARSCGAWFHVDAAWGGAAITSAEHRACLEGIQRADSITVDAHKWFAVTMGCGMILTRWPGLLGQTFQVSADYMPSSSASDPYLSSVQWSRRFLGLRLFLSLAAAGWQGYAEHIERTLGLADLLRERLIARGWRVCNQSPLGVVCIEPPHGTNAKALVSQVVASGKAWVSTACFEGRDVIRACVTSGETTENDIATLVDSLEDAK